MHKSVERGMIMKLKLKEKVVILVFSGMAFATFLSACGQQNIFGDRIHLIGFENIGESVMGEIFEQKDIAEEYMEMRKQKNIREIENDDAAYVGPVNTTADRASVFVKNSEGHIYKYNIYKQNSSFDTYEKYMAYHGCSACALTTLLNATVPELEDHTPDKVISEVQRETFGDEVFEKNFRKKMRSQMPVTMYGITQILDKYNVKNKFVYEFTNEAAVAEITDHLKNGNPVMITLRRKNGNTKWAGTVHTLLLIGLDEKGNAIVCDSANKSWSGNNQRVKFGNVEELVKFMWSSSELSTSAYYSGRKGTSGYILIN